MKKSIMAIMIALFCSGCAGTSIEDLVECAGNLQLLKSEAAIQQSSLDAIEEQLKGNK